MALAPSPNPVDLSGFPGTISKDPRGRLRIYLGKGHPAANSGGWTWLPRFIVWRETGVALSKDEHVHHIDGDKHNNDPDNLAVVMVEFHGRLHAYATLLFRLRDCRGRWKKGYMPSPDPRTYQIPRRAAVAGRAALEAS